MEMEMENNVAQSLTNEEKILFICGCARSGTTALTRLFNAHPQINITIEKYQVDFFMDTSFESLVFDRTAKDENLPVIWAGDKVPSFYKDYGKLFNAYPDSKVLFIFRNIFDVAESYKARQDNDKEPWNKGVRRAVEEWNTSLVNTLEFIDKDFSIIPVVYEKIFFRSLNLLKHFPELVPHENFSNVQKKTIHDAKKISSKKVHILTPKEKLYILNNADFNSYKKLFKLS